jgi:hypothetical protein
LAPASSSVPDGYVLTNNHVVTGEADQSNLTIEKLDVTITMSDKRELPAKLIGTDPATDLALLKIQATGLPTMPWGDSSKLKVAEWVLAIGNPYQLSESVSLGIVSAVGRTGLNVSTFRGFHSDRCRDQPGQLRRRAHQRARRARRHQHGDLLAQRRISGHRLRGLEQPGQKTFDELRNTAKSGAARSATIGSCR